MSGCSWPEPELSLGPVCTSLGDLDKYTCWEVRDESPAHQAWRCILRPIIQLLQDQAQDPDAQETDLMIEMFMIGQDPSTANPTILFSCQDPAIRQRAMELVSKSAILGTYPQYPGIHMAECYRRWRPLAIEGEADVPDLPPGVYATEPLRHCGVSVLISEEQKGPPRRATLGGIVFIAGLFYGIITLYACGQTSLDEGEFEEENEFAFFGLEKHDSGAILTLENISSHLLPSPTSSDSDESTKSPPKTPVAHQKSPQAISNENPRKLKSPPAMNGSAESRRVYHTNLEDDNREISPELGNIFVTAPEKSLDWALVEIENSDLMLETISLNNRRFMTNSIYWSKQSLHSAAIHPRGFAPQPFDIDVLICTGNSDNALEGRLCSIPAFSRTPGSAGFRELWVVTCTGGKFYNGDCGSWVVDCINGTLYGIVAYGYPGTNTAYIIPAFHIFESMQNHLDRQVELSTPELWAARVREVTRVNALPPPPPRPPQLSLSYLQRSDSARTVRTDKNNHPPPLAPAFLEEPHPGMRRRSWSENSIQSTIFDTRSLNSSNGHFSRIPTHLAQQSNASSSHLSVLSNSDRFLSPGSRRPRSSISGSSAPSSHKFRPYSSASTIQSIDSGYLNPPCNNLYVRNLPAEPSEDDLRDLFSTFPGFEGLRMKLNEPECFVQFENVSSAAFALQQTDDHHFSEDDKWGIMVGYARSGVTPQDIVPTQDEIELEISISELLGAETLPSMREVGGRIKKLVRPPRIQVGVPHVHKGLKQVSDKSQMLQEMFALESEERASDKVVITDNDDDEG
ncbi:hypothetical protein BGZ60DRAFT_526656 [Tricladium varicosporioides]|nr:hypothetical protein BGZ60DRAFT_526656 [Hymenoscyphus varicosporioides]